MKIVISFFRLLCCVLIYCIILLLNCIHWVQNEWNGVDFTMLIYQISTPLKGTSHEFIIQFVLKCIVVALFETILYYVFCYYIFKIWQNVSMKWKIKIFDKKYVLSLIYKRRVKPIFYLVSISILFLFLLREMNGFGVGGYMSYLQNPSNLYEEKFVQVTSENVKFPSNRRNLILIYLESMESTYCSTEFGGGKKENYIPELLALAQDNISFSDTEKFGGLYSYSGTGWTMASLLVSSTGLSNLLPIQQETIDSYQKVVPGAVSLGEILKDNGYNNYFMCGSDASFGGRRLFFEQHGDYSIYDYNTAIEDQLIPEDYYEFWGFEDQKLYQYAKNKLTDISKDKPFNFTMLTVDTHHMNGYVCSQCKEEYESQYGNVIACADNQISDFIKWIKMQDWYENTSVIIVGDHTSMNNNFWDDLPIDYNRRTYNCFINTNKEKNNYKNRIAYSMDLFPTILSSLDVQIKGDRLGLGTDLFSATPTLAEEMGAEVFERETMKYSAYFDRHIIQGK